MLYSEIQFIALYSFASLSVTEVEKWWTKNSVGCGSCLCATVNGVSGKRFPAPHQTVLCPLFFRNIAINLDAHPPGYIWNQDGRPYPKALDPDDLRTKEGTVNSLAPRSFLTLYCLEWLLSIYSVTSYKSSRITFAKIRWDEISETEPTRWTRRDFFSLF